MSDQRIRSNDDVSIREIVRSQSVARASSPYLVSVRTTREVSFSELEACVESWGELASSWGLTSSDRVGLLVRDPVDFALCFVALLANGVWVAPMDPTVTYADGTQFEERIAKLRIRCVVSDQPPRRGINIEWRQLSDSTNVDPAPAAREGLQSTSTGGVILASSGTTGTPKIMALPSRQLLETARLVATHNQLEPSDQGLNPLPLWHINAEVVGLLATLVSGSSLALDDRFHRGDFWSMVERLKVTWINAVPAIISRLSTLRSGETVPTRVRFIRSASAPLSPSLLKKFEEDIGVTVIESYGMTEAASQICANPLHGPRKPGSVGRAVGVEVRVVSSARTAAGAISAVNEIGRVEIRGGSVIRQYEGDGYEDRFDREGWLDTGDLGFLDPDGYLFLVGRSDDVINRGGEKIFPREIEDVMLGVRGVTAAAVIGVSDDVFGQVPSSFVQLEGVSDATPLEEVRVATKEIHDALVAAFARARRPVDINVVAQLPTHATGKIQKKDLSAGVVPVLLQEPVS
ncbi:MAG: AMP-binding protein [Acidimicrobiales bacterium]